MASLRTFSTNQKQALSLKSRLGLYFANYANYANYYFISVQNKDFDQQSMNATAHTVKSPQLSKSNTDRSLNYTSKDQRIKALVQQIK